MNKTLQDVRGEIFLRDNLKKAAIEWVLDNRRAREKYKSSKCFPSISDTIEQHKLDAVYFWIMHFFNLSEDDIKGEQKED